MQQALYNPISIQANTANTSASAPKAAGLLRWVARQWDFVGVMALMGSSAAYGVYALAHAGL